MSGINGLLDAVAAGAGPVALETLWKVSFVLLAGSAVTWLLRRQSSSLRHLIWTLTVAGTLAVPIAVLVAPSWEVGVLPAARSAAPAADVRRAGTTSSPTPRAESPRSAIERSTVRTAGTPSPDSGEAAITVRWSWPLTLIAVWLLGAIAVYAWIVSGLISVALLARKANPISDESWLHALHTARERLGIRRTVRLLAVHGNTTPMTFGLFTSTIVLGEEALRWSAARQRIVLLHELAHVGRRDVLVQLIGQIACAAYWFHPLAWYAARQLRIEREHACDDTVVSAGERPSEYATHLLAVARAYRATRALQPAALAMARPSQLEGRLIAVLAPGVRRAQLTGRRVLLSAGVALGTIVPLAALTPVARSVTNTVLQQSADVILHPRPTDPLEQRWSWAFNETARRTPRRGYWIGYSITRQAPAGEAVISGGDLSELRGRALQTQLFGTQPATYRGQGRGPLVTRDIAIMFRFDGRAESIDAASEVRVHSMHVGMNLENLPVYWLGHATDAQSVGWLSEQFYALPANQHRDELIDAVSVHQAASLAVPFLSRVLAEENDAQLRAEAAEGLGEQGSPAAERVLRELVPKDPSVDVRREGAEALGAFTTRTATAALLDLARNADDNDVRMEATEALGEQSTLDALRALEELVFKADDIDVQREAAESLGDMEGDMGFDILYKVLRSHPNWEIRSEAAESMAEIDPQHSISALEESIFIDRDERVQEDAVEAAGDLGESGLPLLRRVIRDHPNPEVRAKAQELLDDAKPRRFLRNDPSRTPSASTSPSPSPSPSPSSSPSPSPSASDPNAEGLPTDELVPVDIDESKLITEEQALRSPEADAILTLREGLTHVPEHEADLVRQRSVWALSQVRNGRIVEPLIAALNNADWRVRAYAGWALAQTKDSRALPALFRAAQDKYWRVRANTFHAIGEIEGRDAERVNALLSGVDDPRWQVRWEAAHYLGGLGGKDAERALKQLVGDGHMLVRDAAIESLTQMSVSKR